MTLYLPQRNDAFTEPYKAHELFMNTYTVGRRQSSSIVVVVTDTQAHYYIDIITTT